MKRKTAALLIAVLLPMLSCGCSWDGFEGRKVKNETEYRLEYSVFTGTDDHVMQLEAGDILKVEIVSQAGGVDLTIGMEGGEPVYRGRQLPDSAFSVRIGVPGEYTIEVSGSAAKGSIQIEAVIGE